MYSIFFLVTSLAGALSTPLFGASISSVNAVPANLTFQNSPVNLCNVSITYTHPGQNDSINIWVYLPDDWNNRFQGVGGGGWVTGSLSTTRGGILDAACRGYAAVITDGGHVMDSSSAGWALRSPGNVDLYALQNFASVALNDMTVLGKQITESYYGQKIKKSYWNGCSTGGRQGLMMAQRYSTAYDGILAAAPAINWAQFVTSEFWPQFVMNRAGYFPSQCELEAINTAAVSACDELDGLKDGIIGKIGSCNFPPESVVGQPYSCPGAAGNISAKAAAIVRDIWAGPRSAEGDFQWYGLPPGTSFRGLANTTCAGNATCSGLPFPISFEWHKFFLQKDAKFDPYSLTQAQWDTAFRASKNQYQSIIGTADADLTDFKKAGGKMISWHGIADQLIPHNGTVNYFERVLALDANATDFYRFFEAPGVEHCAGGAGAEPTDPLASLVAWVEEGEVPQTLAANKTINGTNWERNLCLYPSISEYHGGDPSKASSFQCQ